MLRNNNLVDEAAEILIKYAEQLEADELDSKEIEDLHDLKYLLRDCIGDIRDLLDDIKSEIERRSK